MELEYLNKIREIEDIPKDISDIVIDFQNKYDEAKDMNDIDLLSVYKYIFEFANIKGFKEACNSDEIDKENLNKVIEFGRKHDIYLPADKKINAIRKTVRGFVLVGSLVGTVVFGASCAKSCNTNNQSTQDNSSIETSSSSLDTSSSSYEPSSSPSPKPSSSPSPKPSSSPSSKPSSSPSPKPSNSSETAIKTPTPTVMPLQAISTNPQNQNPSVDDLPELNDYNASQSYSTTKEQEPEVYNNESINNSDAGQTIDITTDQADDIDKLLGSPIEYNDLTNYDIETLELLKNSLLQEETTKTLK